MNGNDYLFDTNVLIYLLQGNPNVRYFAQLSSFAISIVTEMELLGKYQITPSEKNIISAMLKNCSILDIDPLIKQTTIELKQLFRIKLPDAIIAATAIQNGLSLVTADKVFECITNLDVVLIKI
jgi:predicted nucleic acid-binding protein